MVLLKFMLHSTSGVCRLFYITGELKMADQETELLARKACGGRRRATAMKLAPLLLGVALTIGGCASMSVHTAAKPLDSERTATELGSEQVSLLADVPFDFDKSELTPEGLKRLDDLVANLEPITLNTIFVAGHSDSIRSEEYNLHVSRLRAGVVKDYLVSKGIEPNRISIEGYGEQRPIADNKTTQGRAKNNRVDIAVIGISNERSALVPILFATNRARTGHNVPDKYFGDDESKDKPTDRLTLGRALVRVPPNHVKGHLEQPSWWQRQREKLSFGLYTAHNPTIHFSFAYPIEELTDDDFESELRQSLVESKSRSALLYVHGLANSFADAAFRTAQLAFDLQAEGFDVVPLMFSWPSDTNYSDFISFSNYTSAKDHVRSAAQRLAAFLDMVVATTGVGVVHLIGHSMGAEVLATALDQMGKANLVVTGPNGSHRPKFNQVVLAAPDIRASDFSSVILPAIESGHRVTNYASSNDKALRLSKQANAGPRAGDTDEGLMEVSGIETIDASTVNSEFSGHSFFAESVPMIRDLKELLSIGARPEARGLLPVRRRTWTYWLFP